MQHLQHLVHKKVLEFQRLVEIKVTMMEIIRAFSAATMMMNTRGAKDHTMNAVSTRGEMVLLLLFLNQEQLLQKIN